MKAIPTRYAGCHFRSRLEARWAVFFDALGIRWEYEPQGFELDWRLRLENGDAGPIHYLPDFYLPDSNTYVEIKGRWTPDECDRFLNAAAALSGHCGGPNIVLLSSVPEPSEEAGPPVLHMHKGDLMAGGWEPFAGWQCGGYGNASFIAIGRDVGGQEEVYLECGNTLRVLTTVLLSGFFPTAWWKSRPVAVALNAARSARFEHGESGST
jgi:hypothetical protein